MKTDKFNAMICRFGGDFSLIKDNPHLFFSLFTLFLNSEPCLLNDISLLSELEYLLKRGKAEIHIIEK